MEEDIEICHCMSVNKSTIVEAIQSKGLRIVEEVSNATEAGTGAEAAWKILKLS